MRRIKHLLIVALFFANAGYGQVLYWNMPTTPEQVTYGSGAISKSTEPYGLEINPASLGFIKYRSIRASGIQWWQDVYGGSANVLLPVKRYGTLSLNLGYWSLGSITEMTEEGQPLGTIQSQAASLLLGFGTVLSGAFGLGIDIKGSRLDLPDRYDWGWAADVALQYRRGLFNGLLTVRDLGPDNPVNNGIRYPLNTEYVAGFNFRYFENILKGSLQYSVFKEGESYPALALEISPITNFSLSLGYDKQKNISERSPLGLGMELRQLGKRDLMVAYGYRSYGALGNINSIAMGINF